MTTEDHSPELPVLEKKTDVVVSSISPITPPSHDEPVVNRWELWSYYLYFCDATLTIFQSLATAAGYDPIRGPGSSCTDARASGKCVLPWGSGTKPVNSVVLLANGMSFAVTTVILTVIGPAADYGSFGRWPLLVASLIHWGLMFSTMSLTSPSQWGAAMGVYVVGFVAYNATLAFYAAIFPRLALNTQRLHELREKFDRGKISTNEYEQSESLEKSKISSASIAASSCGTCILLLLDLAILIPLQGNAKVNNYVILLSTALGVLTGIWWFIFRQPRPGPELPKGEHYLTIGWKQIWTVLKQYKKLPNTFIYLFAYFLFYDGQTTTLTLVQICQNVEFTFSIKYIVYLSLVQEGTSIVGMVSYWHVQRYWKIDSKKMLTATMIAGVTLPLWGMIGIWTDKFGYHNKWEFWAHHVVFGLSYVPFYAYSQTLIAELSPPGFDFMFFSLFGLTSRASSVIGPTVIQAIIDKTDNTWQGFSFLFAICLVASLVICLAVDVPQGRQDAERWAAEQRELQGIDTKYKGKPEGTGF
ncbi:MFS general substrate transporter [Russula brevipes]|nr:MFS general substrate transporter [Russula brevipes]